MTLVVRRENARVIIAERRDNGLVTHRLEALGEGAEDAALVERLVLAHEAVRGVSDDRLRSLSNPDVKVPLAEILGALDFLVHQDPRMVDRILKIVRQQVKNDPQS